MLMCGLTRGGLAELWRSRYLCAVTPQPQKQPSGRWRVRWRDAAGKRRQRQFDTKAQADRWCAEVVTRRQSGELATLIPSKITLDELAAEWLAGPGSELAPESQRSYVGVISKHIIGPMGAYPVAAIDTRLVTEWQAQLKRHGVTPDPRARAMKYLRMLLSYAVATGRISSNPAMGAKMPTVPKSEPLSPLSPRQVEAIRFQIEREGRPADSILVAMMAYAGLRPSEATSIRWADVGQRSLMVPATKTNTYLPVMLLAPLADDLRRWRMQSGRPGERSLIVPPPKASKWSRTTRDNWRNRIFTPAAQRAGTEATPYLLRHSFASLLIHAGLPLTYVAQQMRHSVAMTADRYARVIADLDPSERIDPAQEILRARNGVADASARMGTSK